MNLLFSAAQWSHIAFVWRSLKTCGQALVTAEIRPVRVKMKLTWRDEMYSYAHMHHAASKLFNFEAMACVGRKLPSLPCQCNLTFGGEAVMWQGSAFSVGPFREQVLRDQIPWKTFI